MTKLLAWAFCKRFRRAARFAEDGQSGVDDEVLK
jgi:hypothetical protein